MTSPQETAVIVERRDASVIEQWDMAARIYRRYDCSFLVEERPFTEAENAAADNRLTDQTRRTNHTLLLGKARAAFASNRAYLDKVAAGIATNADHIAQVPALTRQMQALTRLVVGADLLDTIAEET